MCERKCEREKQTFCSLFVCERTFFRFASSSAKIFRFSFVSYFLKIPGELVRFFRTSQRSMPFEGQRRWLEASQVSRVVDLERRSVKTQDSIRFWSDFSGLPRGLCFWKVREGGWRSERSQG